MKKKTKLGKGESKKSWRANRLKMWDICEGNCGFCYPKVYSACKSKKKKERGALSRGKYSLTKQIIENEIEELEDLANELYEGRRQNREYAKTVGRVGEANTEEFELMKGGESSGTEAERYTE